VLDYILLHYSVIGLEHNMAALPKNYVFFLIFG